MNTTCLISAREQSSAAVSVGPLPWNKNTSMYLGAITLGKKSSVGLKSVIAPGSVIPENKCIGPNSSSWEMQDATESNHDLSSKRIPKPHPIMSLLLGLPIQILVAVLAKIPWAAGLVGIVITEPVKSLDEVQTLTIWFAQGKHVAFHFLARILGVSVGPFVLFLSIALVKLVLDKLIGKTKPGPASRRSQAEKFRMSLLSSLLCKGEISKLTELFGSHYEITSISVRALGGKVGSRVYWLGTGPVIQDFDLLDVGNDVVFGSRSHIVTSDGTGSDYVRAGDGAMIVDRVIMLPGSTVGSAAVLGSGALARRNGTYPAETVWIGSKGGDSIYLSASSNSTDSGKTVINYRKDPLSSLNRSFKEVIKSRDVEKALQTDILTDTVASKSLEEDRKRKGTEIIVTEEPCSTPVSEMPPLITEQRSTTKSTLSPFGRVFYAHEAPYHVLGIPTIFLYSLFTNIFIAIYWNVPAIVSIQVLAHVMPLHPSIFQSPAPARPLAIYGLITACISALLAIQSILAIALVITAKWTLIGRRKPGNYSWDKSSYSQRWQIFLTIERLRRHCFGGLGIINLLTGTHYAVLYFRALGARIGKDCALFAGGHSSVLFTEPDLLTLGDRVSVDDASLVGHVNSRGDFSLNELKVGSRSVLRTGSRLLSGAVMGEDCVLLEHTLVMAGMLWRRGLRCRDGRRRSLRGRG